MEAICISAYAEAFEIIPYTLAENAGLHPISIVTELRNRHAKGEKTAGINVRKVSPMGLHFRSDMTSQGEVADILQENIVQPLLVTSSAVRLATETVCMILKIDDIVSLFLVSMF